MDLKWCVCNRERDDPIHRGAGDSIVCSKCNGFIICDVCKLEHREVANFPLALVVIGAKFVCPEHVWTGIAKTGSPKDSN